LNIDIWMNIFMDFFLHGHFCDDAFTGMRATCQSHEMDQ